jgi:TonB family protein
MTIHDVWERVFPPEKRWLGLVIVGSLALHVMGMVLLDVRWPEGSRFPVRPRQATLMSSAVGWSGGTREGLELWMRWRDPSVIAIPRSPLPDPPQMADMRPRPESWELPESLGQAAPLMPEERDHSLREEIREWNLLRRAKPSSLPVVAPSPLSGSRVKFQGSLAEREVIKRVPLPRPQTSESLKVTVLLLGVRPDGGVDSVFVEESSLDSSVDQKGIEALKQWRFAPTEASGNEFGRVIVYWDLIAEPAAQDTLTSPYNF